ncbi:MAG TPA: zf-HC2 domain-containing protein [Pyrinomonadaceae bacterium]|nr:zf-HC2 domain-containing protein [Pyrinomonadaceae bacterium]
MKCNDCLNLLEMYIDGEAGERNNDQVREHLMKCESCTGEFEALTAESELYQRYDRDLQISPAVWNGIAARITENHESVAKPKSSLSEWFAGLFAIPHFGFAMPAVAMVLIALVLGVAYWRTRQSVAPPDQIAKSNIVTPPAAVYVGPDQPTKATPIAATAGNKHADEFLAAKIRRPESKNRRGDSQSDVLFTDAAYTDMEDRDTATHLQQAQDLLVSVRNIQLSDDDQEIDVSYEKAESRRLLNENVVLRRDAEMAGKFPAKSVLGSLEPFLIDIANLPEKATPNDVRQIKDRVQKTEIVAELKGY